MKRLEGIHHISCITADARSNVEFYTGVLGLRLVGKSVNQDDPYVYHLFYADELGHPGSDLTFFEYPDAAPGRAGGGMIHRIVWRVGSADATAFWAARLEAAGVAVQRTGDALQFADAEGLVHALVVNATEDAPLVAEHPEIPRAMALQGFDGVRAYSGNPERSRRVLEEVMGATSVGEHAWELRGERRGGTYVFDAAPPARGIPGAGTVHHVAWRTSVAEHPTWVDHLKSAGVHSTPVVDRHFFRSIYFREPSGVLFEIADDGPGFALGGPTDHLGERVILPPWFEPRRAEIEARLTQLPNPRAGWKKAPSI
jgi:glyoxalase family protein